MAFNNDLIKRILPERRHRCHKQLQGWQRTLGALSQIGERVALSGGIECLPIGQPPIVQGVGCDEMSNAAALVYGSQEIVFGSDRRV